MFSNRRNFSALLIALFCFSPSAYGQLTNVDVFIQAGAADAEALSKAYLAPVGRGFGADLNSGWANTAKTHGLLGFDITIMGSAAVTPGSDKSFDLSTLDLQHIRLSNPTANSTAPTVIGSDNAGPQVDIFVNNPFTGQDEKIGESFELPPGLDFNYVPSPMVQASVGLLMNTDVIIRYFPDTEIDKDIGKAGLFGFGLKHDLLQYFPGGGLLPIDLSLLVGWTSFEATAGLDVFVDPSDASNADLNSQEVELDADSFTMNLLLSKKFALLTLFGSVGFENSSVNLRLNGNYPITVIETNPVDPMFGQEVKEIISDPVDVSIDGANDFRASAGFQLSFVFFNVYGNYTFAQYPVANLGLAFGFR